MISLAQVAAVTAASLLTLIVVLQLALALGAPLGQLAWRGRHRVLPPSLRLGSLAAALLLTAASWIILARVSLMPPGPGPAIHFASWSLAVVFGVNTLGNLSSPSRGERLIMTPITVVLAVCFVLAASSRT